MRQIRQPTRKLNHKDGLRFYIEIKSLPLQPHSKVSVGSVSKLSEGCYVDS